MEGLVPELYKEAYAAIARLNWRYSLSWIVLVSLVMTVLISRPTSPVAVWMNSPVSVKGWPFDAISAKGRLSDEPETKKSLELAPGIMMNFVRIPANNPEQLAIRVSWEETMSFGERLSAKIGLKVTLPTEVQWEWACRAGSGSDFWYGDLNTDFASYENMADQQLNKLAVRGGDP